MTKRGRPNWGRPKRRRTILASLLLLSSTTPTASNLFTSCYDDLYAADEDGDGIINKDEYIYFVSGLSNGYLASESYGDLPFLLRMNFVELSCRCKYHPRSEEYGGEDCCLGSRQGIYAFGAGPEEIPSEGEEAYLHMACEDTLGAIEYEVGPLPTASPSTGAPLSVDLPENYLFFIDGGPFESGALGLCQGDCDNDGECAGDLVCFQRNGNTTVPGCEGEGRKGSDHCILPEDAPQTPNPTPRPTAARTPSPTPPPTDSPPTPPQIPYPWRPPPAPKTPNPTQQPTTLRPVTDRPSRSPITDSPTEWPTISPITDNPTPNPTPRPTLRPITESPTEWPTEGPVTNRPSRSPITDSPTEWPTSSPVTSRPTPSPTPSPVDNDDDVVDFFISTSTETRPPVSLSTRPPVNVSTRPPVILSTRPPVKRPTHIPNHATDVPTMLPTTWETEMEDDDQGSGGIVTFQDTSVLSSGPTFDSLNSGNIPCREAIDYETSGRVEGLDCSFCGFCKYKSMDFSCYDRIGWLVTQYGMAGVEARQSLCDRNHCLVPEGGVDEEIQMKIEMVSYCEDKDEDEGNDGDDGEGDFGKDDEIEDFYANGLTSSDVEEDTEGTQMKSIIPGVIGGIIAALVLCIGICWFIRREKNGAKDDGLSNDTSDSDSNEETTDIEAGNSSREGGSKRKSARLAEVAGLNGETTDIEAGKSRLAVVTGVKRSRGGQGEEERPPSTFPGSKVVWRMRKFVQRFMTPSRKAPEVDDTPSRPAKKHKVAEVTSPIHRGHWTMNQKGDTASVQSYATPTPRRENDTAPNKILPRKGEPKLTPVGSTKAKGRDMTPTFNIHPREDKRKPIPVGSAKAKAKDRAPDPKKPSTTTNKILPREDKRKTTSAGLTGAKRASVDSLSISERSTGSRGSFVSNDGVRYISDGDSSSAGDSGWSSEDHNSDSDDDIQWLDDNKHSRGRPEVEVILEDTAKVRARSKSKKANKRTRSTPRVKIKEGTVEKSSIGQKAVSSVEKGNPPRQENSIFSRGRAPVKGRIAAKFEANSRIPAKTQKEVPQERKSSSSGKPNSPSIKKKENSLGVNVGGDEGQGSKATHKFPAPAQISPTSVINDTKQKEERVLSEKEEIMLSDKETRVQLFNDLIAKGDWAGAVAAAHSTKDEKEPPKIPEIPDIPEIPIEAPPMKPKFDSQSWLDDIVANKQQALKENAPKEPEPEPEPEIDMNWNGVGRIALLLAEKEEEEQKAQEESEQKKNSRWNVFR